MTSVATSPGPSPAWHRWLQSEPRETRVPQRLQLLRGHLPADLHGTLYRNGPKVFETPCGERVRHLFDAAAGLQKFDFKPCPHTQEMTCEYSSRHVITDHHAQELRASRRLYGGAGWLPPDGIFGVLRGRADKNTGATHVAVYAGVHMVLHENAAPTRFDPHSLAWLGPHTFGGLLRPGTPFSAHPKLHPRTGEMYNFGLTLGSPSTVRVYRIATDGSGEELVQFKLPFMTTVHDFILTERRAIFVVPPLQVHALGLLTGTRAHRDGVTLRQNVGTRIFVVDLETLRVEEKLAPPFVMFHAINGWDEDDAHSTVDISAYANADLLPTLHDMMREGHVATYPAHTLRLQVGPQAQVETVTLHADGLDFPRLLPAMLGRRSDQCVGVTWDRRAPLPSLPAQLMVQGEGLRVMDLPPDEFVGELVPVLRRGGSATDLADAYLLALANTPDGGEIRCLHLRGGDGPREVFAARTPTQHPFGFHGNFLPAGSDVSVA